ncbi:MAG: DUF4405 domain-containing protein [Candidatus Bilamarchaeaceae archaeon]
MKVKQKIRGIVVLVLLILFILSSVSGFSLYFLPSGPRSGQIMMLGFQKKEWIQIHSLISFLLVAIGILHIVLELPILIAIVKQLFKKEK